MYQISFLVPSNSQAYHTTNRKTMLANAIATKLGVKLLLVNFPDFGVNSSGAIIKFFFREARINKALLSFDECESLFMSRNKQGGGGSVNMLLTELERWDGICILATNRAFDLDEATHRLVYCDLPYFGSSTKRFLTITFRGSTGGSRFRSSSRSQIISCEKGFGRLSSLRDCLLMKTSTLPCSQGNISW